MLNNQSDDGSSSPILTIQSLGFSFAIHLEKNCRRRLMFNIEAVLASIEGGTTKRPGWSKDFFRPGECSKRNGNTIAYLDAGDSRPDRLDDSGAFTSDNRRKLRI